MYLYWSKPFIGFVEMKVDMVNEITILIATENTLMFTDLCTPDQQSLVGWYSFYIFMFQLAINFIKMMSITSYRFYLVLQKYLCKDKLE
jgi:hypothetical protein